MDVNIYGPYRVTRAFAPLIIESRGRIAIIGSISGVLSSSTWGPYAMSKHAMEAYGDALKDEMKRFGVEVSLIEPGTYTSKIADQATLKAQQQYQAAGDSPFQADVKENVEWINTHLKESGEPDDVSRAVMLALFGDNPKPRYMVVPNQDQARETINRSMEKLVKLNADQAYSFDRAALIEMLDQALAAQSQ